MPDLMTALRNADAAGDTEAASRIAGMIKAQQSGPESQPEKQEEGFVAKYTPDVVLEAMAAVNRGAVDMADLPATLGNAVLELSGSDQRIPTIKGSALGKAATTGGYMEEGLGRDIVMAAGELAAPTPPIVAAGKVGSKLLTSADDLAKAAQIADP